mmetsp:Transcript_40434/g.114506  ORF Transcript_40434/g.114506 Transcript_40434/m.114506 type:complete len:237 (+) Transcript_40434:273-983(+)
MASNASATVVRSVARAHTGVASRAGAMGRTCILPRVGGSRCGLPQAPACAAGSRGRRGSASVARVQTPRDTSVSPASSVNPFGDDCVERTETSAYKAVAMSYFAQVGQAEPDLRSVMLDGCVMTDRVLGWCFRGREAVEGHFRDFYSKYSSHEFSHLDVLTNLDERTVCAHWALTVVTAEPPAGVPPQAAAAGVPLPKETCQMSGVHLFTLDADNKIADIVTYRTACNADSKFGYA